ncbi:hypothetical protein BH10ACI3_BH10ACI3_25600 [soil metagenome]
MKTIPIDRKSAEAIHPCVFESYGVIVNITSNHQHIVDAAGEVARVAMLDNFRRVSSKAADYYFDLKLTEAGTYRIFQNGVRIASGRSYKKTFHFFDALVRVAIGESAKDRVFMHAGVVGWRGKAIVMPADSFQGKTTLVAELVKKGAEYYSDEFAVLDADGMVYPFARNLTMRTREGSIRQFDVTVDDLGGRLGTGPIPVGMVILTGYKPNAHWSPELLTPGGGVIGMIPFTLSLQKQPDFSIQVLKNIAGRAIIARSLRGTAENLAKRLLNFVDKHVN